MLLQHKGRLDCTRNKIHCEEPLATELSAMFEKSVVKGLRPLVHTKQIIIRPGMYIVEEQVMLDPLP